MARGRGRAVDPDQHDSLQVEQLDVCGVVIDDGEPRPGAGPADGALDPDAAFAAEKPVSLGVP